MAQIQTKIQEKKNLSAILIKNWNNQQFWRKTSQQLSVEVSVNRKWKKKEIRIYSFYTFSIAVII